MTAVPNVELVAQHGRNHANKSTLGGMEGKR